MKTKTTKLIVIIIVFLIIIFGIAIFGIVPTMNKLVLNRVLLVSTKQDLLEVQKKLENLNQLKKNEFTLNDVKNTIESYMPQNPQSSSFVVQLEALAADLSIPEHISTITTTEPEVKKENKSSTSKIDSKDDSSNNTSSNSKKKESDITFSLKFESNYSTIIEFINRMYTFPRLNIFDTVTISGYDPSTDSLDLSISGKIYHGK